MSGIFLEETPPVIILEPPGRPVQGAHRYKCMVCAELFRISDTSYQTVRDLRRTRRLYLVVCFSCHRELMPALPTSGNIAADMNTARAFLGYR